MRDASPGMQPSPDPVARIANPASRKFIQRGDGVAKNQEAITAILSSVAAEK